MTRHRDLTGPAAVHPFAFIQSTDPALDAGNGVTARKAWIDTGDSYALKVRNDANTAWITVLGPAGDASIVISWITFIAVYVGLSFDAYALSDYDFVELEYVP